MGFLVLKSKYFPHAHIFDSVSNFRVSHIWKALHLGRYLGKYNIVNDVSSSHIHDRSYHKWGRKNTIHYTSRVFKNYSKNIIVLQKYKMDNWCWNG